jgi:hypothetical protein
MQLRLTPSIALLYVSGQAQTDSRLVKQDSRCCGPLQPMSCSMRPSERDVTEHCGFSRPPRRHPCRFDNLSSQICFRLVLLPPSNFPLTALHNSQRPLDTAAEQAWPDLRENINRNLTELDGIVKHVNDVTSYSRVNQERQFKNISLRYALIPESEEPGVFPNIILPFRQNPRFYGREVELEKIEKYLSPKDDQSLRTYTIYGRRGVGKTEIALQFAYMNQPGFDAIFWIQCETSVAIRQSFTNVAVALNLPAADRDGHHEENQLAVQNWLKKTCWSSLDEQLYLGY